MSEHELMRADDAGARLVIDTLTPVFDYALPRLEHCCEKQCTRTMFLAGSLRAILSMVLAEAPTYSDAMVVIENECRAALTYTAEQWAHNKAATEVPSQNAPSTGRPQ